MARCCSMGGANRPATGFALNRRLLRDDGPDVGGDHRALRHGRRFGRRVGRALVGASAVALAPLRLLPAVVRCQGSAEWVIGAHPPIGSGELRPVAPEAFRHKPRLGA